jgi:hypothetical protein
MPIYFMLLDAPLFQGEIRPALSASWRQRSFEPCCSVCAALALAARAFVEKYHAGPDEPLLLKVGQGLPFDRHFWTLLAGELLLFAAAEIPEFQTAPDTLCCLLAPEQYQEGDVPRERFAPIQQAHFGTRDLVFGGKAYRPGQAGYNDTDEVDRLSAYLACVNPDQWSVAGLASFPAEDDEERAEELECVRDWFPALRQLYERAHEFKQLVVCEIL